MYFEAKVSLDLQVPARFIALDEKIAAMNQVNLEYQNKMVPEIGLFICGIDITQVSQKEIKHNQSEVVYSVEMAAMFFIPQVGMWINGFIIGVDEKGVQIGTGFFNNIYVKKSQFPDGSLYTEEEKVVSRQPVTSKFWKYHYDEDGQDYCYTIGSHVRCIITEFDLSSGVVQGSFKNFQCLGYTGWWED